MRAQKSLKMPDSLFAPLRIFQQMTVKENLEMGAFSRPNEELAASMERVYSFFPRLKEREKQISPTV